MNPTSVSWQPCAYHGGLTVTFQPRQHTGSGSFIFDRLSNGGCGGTRGGNRTTPGGAAGGTLTGGAGGGAVWIVSLSSELASVCGGDDGVIHAQRFVVVVGVSAQDNGVIHVQN